MDPAFINEKNWEHLPTTHLLGDGREVSVTDLFVASGLCPSKNQARKLIEGGGAYVDGERVTDIEAKETSWIGDWLILRKGKKHYHKIVFDKDEKEN